MTAFGLTVVTFLAIVILLVVFGIYEECQNLKKQSKTNQRSTAKDDYEEDLLRRRRDTEFRLRQSTENYRRASKQHENMVKHLMRHSNPRPPMPSKSVTLYDHGDHYSEHPPAKD